MKIKALLDEGRIGPAVELLVQDVKAHPGDASLRTMLFDLLAYSGEWTRAGKQLDVIGHQVETPQMALGVQLCRQLLQAEIARAEFWSRGTRPRFMVEPPPSVEAHLKAVVAFLREPGDATQQSLEEAASLRKPTIGKLAKMDFDDFRDADDLLAPVLEVFAPAGYCWVPWEQIQFLEVTPPKNLRDLLWIPAKLASFDGQLGEVYLPNLYPDSWRHDDDAVKLGRKTEWVEGLGGIVRGAGMKVFLVGDEDRTLPELGSVQFAALVT